jgi:hypothetical protein
MTESLVVDALTEGAITAFSDARGESPVSMEVRWHTRSGDVRLISWICTALTALGVEPPHFDHGSVADQVQDHVTL